MYRRQTGMKSLSVLETEGIPMLQYLKMGPGVQQELSNSPVLRPVPPPPFFIKPFDRTNASTPWPRCNLFSMNGSTVPPPPSFLAHLHMHERQANVRKQPEHGCLQSKICKQPSFNIPLPACGDLAQDVGMRQDTPPSPPLPHL